MNQLLQLVSMWLTVAQEAGGETYTGKLAVAYVIRNRSTEGGKSFSDICFKPYQFSCWNTESPTRMGLDNQPERVLAECLQATLAAAFRLELDPTNGAIYYMNKTAVIQAAGKLPDWWINGTQPDSEINIGLHSFRGPKVQEV